MGARLSHQLPIGEVPRVDDSFHGIAEDMRIIAVVVTPFQFFEITIQMLDAHLVEGSDDRTLEQRPNALDAIGVDIAHHPFLGRVAHSFMARVVIRNPEVRLQLIGVNGLSLILDRSMDEPVQGVAFDIGDALDTDLPSTLDGTCDPGLVTLVGMALAFRLATYQCLIYFDDAQERGASEGVVSHGLADAVAQIPGRAVGADAKRSHHLISGDPFLGFAHEVDGREPLAQGKVGIVHNSSDGHAEMVIATQTHSLVPPFDPGDRQVSATQTGNAVGPAEFFQVFPALIVAVETIKQSKEVHWHGSVS